MNNRNNNNIVIIAGEASGDQHAAALVKELQKQNPYLIFSGLGGQKLIDCNVDIYFDLTKIAVVGFIEVLKHYFTFRKVFYLILKRIKKIKPSAIILVDYPGFNLRLAKEIKKLKLENTKIIYYISPQVWAWKENRVFSIKKYIDKMLVVFDFEKDFYAKFNYDADFVGHPLIDNLDIKTSRTEILESYGLAEFKFTIGLLSGSREKEVKQLLPIMIKTANIIHKFHPTFQFTVIKAPTINKSLLENIVNEFADNTLKIKIINERSIDAINATDFCIVASGTATLETAILAKPMVIIYKTSPITYLLAKLFVKIKFIGLVNIIANKQIVPELIQNQANPKNLSQTIENIINDDDLMDETKHELFKIKKKLGLGGASFNAAKIILETISK